MDVTSNGKGSDKKDDNFPPEEKEKTLSPLAMAAADWLEDEEDELATYWDRFDATKNSGKLSVDNKVQTKQTKEESPSRTTTDTTEQLLDRYFQRRGIDKAEETKYATQIRKATDAAVKASSAEEAIIVLEPIRQYLQFNTKIGGNAYFEIAQALDANGEDDKASYIYTRLAASPHADIRKKSREILSTSPREKRIYKKNVWNFFWNDIE
jgi:hypothetical protein